MIITLGKERSKSLLRSVPLLARAAAFCLLVFFAVLTVHAQSKFEKRRVDNIVVAFSGVESTNALAEQYKLTIRETLGNIYSTTRVRDTIEALYATRNIDTVSVSASLNASDGVDLRYEIKRKTQAERIALEVTPSVGDKVSEEDLRFKLDLLAPGTAITDQSLKDDADEILDYLRERGFYRSEVNFDRKPLATENDVAVTYRIVPGEQAKVEDFRINIEGIEKLKKPLDPKSLKLEKDDYYSRDRLTASIAKIREVLRNENYLAPELDEPRVTYDSDTNKVLVELKGKIGPVVNIVTQTGDDQKPQKATRTDLYPVKRDGTLDYSAIVEGERRLENYYQEQGYFFADVTPVCSVTPQISDIENNPIANETSFLCSFLGGEDLMGREVEVKYKVDLNRRLRLREIRIRGTDKITYEDVSTVLRTQPANILGIIPILGYGRGYTSATLLQEDQATLKSIMAELGYREAQVIVNQGVSIEGEDLIITFFIDEGIPTVVNEVAIVGNKVFTTAELEAQIPVLAGRNYSRARVRNAVQKISEYYSSRGYYDAKISSALVETPAPEGAEKQDVRVELRVENEGKIVRVGDILIGGVDRTKPKAVLKALTLKKGDLLRATDIYTSEQNLYSSDAFSRVDIKPQPAGDSSTGERMTNIVVNVEEQAPRVASYGGGFSTDTGLNGFFDIRHVNLLGNLWQGGARVKMSQRQQLVQFDFINPRFLRDGEKRFTPLTLSLQYQRDTTVTRFFRSAFDNGTFGIVQRVDANGNPIDEFGRDTGDPTINRLSFTAETSRTISRKSRSIAFLRYRFEDVRLFKINSLLIKDLLLPDAKTRISGLGLTFARDTRQNCSQKQSLLDLIAKGEVSDPCRYNASDPTRGQFVTAEYNVSLPALGANIGFQKFQLNYNFFYSIGVLRRTTTFAARVILGAAQVFSGGDRFTGSSFPSLNGLLPVSERFFAGGSNSIRGFNFEEAGPRVAIVPTGIFRRPNGDTVSLDPFTVPFGGNALAVVNLEARVGLGGAVRLVPFYDGGNVFRRPGDIFKAPPDTPTNVALQNQRALWTHTAGFGIRLKTPVGGEFGVDYGRLLNPPRFLIPQSAGGNAIYQLPKDHLHFRFSQAF